MQPRGNSYDAVFGYQNDNQVAVRIPVGARNGFSPAPANRGQVSEFLPGHVEGAFRVLGIPKGTSLTWSVTFAGTTVTTTADVAIDERCGEPPEVVEPIGVFACVTSRGAAFDVTFGYLNPNPVAIDLPIGEENRFLPGRFDRGQPSVFLPGRVEDAFTVRGVSDTALLAWYVSFNGRSVVVVGDGYPVRCAGEQRDVPLTLFPLCATRTGPTYTATFGYQNVNGREVVVPRGDGNRISPSRFDDAQPTRFRPGLVPIAAVIEGIPVSQSVTWVVRSFGASETHPRDGVVGRLPHRGGHGSRRSLDRQGRRPEDRGRGRSHRVHPDGRERGDGRRGERRRPRPAARRARERRLRHRLPGPLRDPWPRNR